MPWRTATLDDLVETIAEADKQRHEMADHSIHSLYGHSLAETIAKPKADPQLILFHGTSPGSWDCIQREGVKPMARHYVHLPMDEEMALQAIRQT